MLARLHAVDYEAVGLGDFGRPAGYLERQVKRWQTQWEKSKTVEMPAVDEVAQRLERHLPTDSRHAIVHGDYSFNNTMFRRDDPTRMQAVLDWEMSTLGDPLTDVGMVAVYWTDVGEIMWRNRKPQAHRANAGFPDVDTLLARYDDDERHRPLADRLLPRLRHLQAGRDRAGRRAARGAHRSRARGARHRHGAATRRPRTRADEGVLMTVADSRRLRGVRRLRAAARRLRAAAATWRRSCTRSTGASPTTARRRSVPRRAGTTSTTRTTARGRSAR